jgi:Asp-tRNA(Asn)/Glu-tRNA(Gln) amidotransferase A subunit family amidase
LGLLKKAGVSIDRTAKTPSADRADKMYDAYLSSHFEAFLKTGEMPMREAVPAVLLAIASWGKLDRRFHPNTAFLLGLLALGRGTLHRDKRKTTLAVRDMQNTCNEIWSKSTLLISPTTTFPAPHHGRAAFVRRLVAFAKLGNLTDSTSLAVPFGKFPNGLPRSIQVLGPAGSEDAVLDLGEKLEHAARA